MIKFAGIFIRSMIFLLGFFSLLPKVALSGMLLLSLSLLLFVIEIKCVRVFGPTINITFT